MFSQFLESIKLIPSLLKLKDEQAKLKSEILNLKLEKEIKTIQKIKNCDAFCENELRRAVKIYTSLVNHSYSDSLNWTQCMKECRSKPIVFGELISMFYVGIIDIKNHFEMLRKRFVEAGLDDGNYTNLLVFYGEILKHCDKLIRVRELHAQNRHFEFNAGEVYASHVITSCLIERYERIFLADYLDPFGLSTSKKDSI